LQIKNNILGGRSVAAIKKKNKKTRRFTLSVI
jgi:hypothetical protein